MSQSTELSVYAKGLITFKEIQEKAKTLQVTDDTLGFAGETMVLAKRLASALDEERIAEGGPHYEEYKKVNERFNAVIKPCQEIAGSIEKKIAAFNRAKREEAERKQKEYERQQREAEEKRLAEEKRQKEEYERRLKEAENDGSEPPAVAPVVAKEELPSPPVIAPPTDKISTMFGTAKVKERWTFVIKDIAQVDRAWLTLDEKKVLKAINQIKDPVRSIKGLDIRPEE